MKKFFNYLLFLNFIASVITIVPIWDFNKSVIKHSDKSSFKVIDKTIDGDLYFRLKKNFKKEKNSFKKTNILELYQYIQYREDILLTKEVDFEGIDLAIMGNSSYYVCPKGKFHLYIYKKDGSFEKFNPGNIMNNFNWDLKCYFQKKLNYIFVSYTNGHNYFYQLDINTQKVVNNINFKQGLFDFKWTTESNSSTYNMFSLYSNLQYPYLGAFNVTIEQGKGFQIEDIISKKIFERLKKNYYLNFNEYNDYFYFINYNNITDFQAGSSEEYEKIDNNNLQNINAIINNINPLEFIDELTIEEMKFIPNTRYVYYKLLTQDNKDIYQGIIDISLNKVIFNTNVNITTFIPLTNQSMLAIAYNNLYEICPIYYNSKCFDVCPDGTYLVLDINERNTCKESLNCSNYTLKPNDICVDACNLSIYTSNEKKECGLCRDLNSSNSYKLINKSECLASIPEGTTFINENLKLLRCANGFKYEDGKCVSMNCYKTCDTCSEGSNNETDQKCLTCKGDYVFHQGNCISTCPLGFFKSGNKCDKCDDGCKNCFNKADYCLSCNIGFYFKENENKCYQCHKNCNSCEEEGNNDNEKCKTCNNNFYLIEAEGFGNNCVSKCPEKTKLDKSGEKCILNDEDNSTIKIVLIILFVLLGIIIIFLSVVCIRRCINRKNSNGKLFDNIKKTDLLYDDRET